MSMRLQAAVFAALVAACDKSNIKLETPPDQLPALIVPSEMMARDGGGGSGGGDVVADNGGGRDWGGGGVDGGNDGVDGGGGGRSSAGALVSASPQPTAYALIIGIEKYRDVTPATGARADAERFAELTRQTFGVPEEHVRVLLDDRATRTDIVKQVRWLQTNVPAGGRIYVYFSGHGAPDPTSGVSYIVPYDGDPQYLGESALKMADILADLEKTKAKDVLAIADSCFSGAGGRSVLAPGTRPLVHVEPVKAAARVALLSASSGAEISGPAPDGKGGLFSKYLMQALGDGAADINGDGQISLKELDEWIKPRVKREAKKANREQTPSLQVGKKLGDPVEFIVSWGYGK
ncbi:MAG: caspase family protein [Myxococcales bacterium]|nr:caspase family protein [Myxococcales bacterium]